ncbi:MAG: DUF2973 domain-containing protein [Spirulina sp. SIO3F2]|nr:DUF2973 domain-containing protein [Spirulina sp. SIO3F2]
MLHLLYILAFTCIAFLAMSSIIRSLMTLGMEPNRRLNNPKPKKPANVPHPELLDEQGQPIEEPLLVIRSVNVDEAREKLDAIFEASPSPSAENGDEA